MLLEVTYYKTPIGTAKIAGDNDGIQSISILNEDQKTDIPKTQIPACLLNCVTQLDEYFRGQRTVFELKLNPQGTPFQKKVWQKLRAIPFHKTWSYLEQSKDFGDVKAIRAVASANGKNPIWIVIPCHRVIASNGSLIGYAGGIWRKKWLLAHENPVKQQSLF